MLQTIARWFFLILSGLILTVGLFPSLQRWLNQHGLIPNQYSHGDLYNLTNLPAFREENFDANAELQETDKPKKQYGNVHLYTIGDSFTDIDTAYYAGGRNVHVWVGNPHPMVAPLDTTKKNIMVLQFIERVLQERVYTSDFRGMYIEKGLVRLPKQSPDNVQVVMEDGPKGWLFARFGEEINQRLEFILFNSKLFIWFKELKANIMLYWFGRVTGGVISHDKKHLFYTAEADSAYVLSSFRLISDRQIDTLVNNLNIIRRHYLRMGFDEVYVCMIPNKVTIIDPTYGTYNHQIERIEANPHLEAPVISVIDTLRRHPEWYHLGDGHWNSQGKRFWLRRVNTIVAQWATKQNAPDSLR